MENKMTRKDITCFDGEDDYVSLPTLRSRFYSMLIRTQWWLRELPYHVWAFFDPGGTIEFWLRDPKLNDKFHHYAIVREKGFESFYIDGDPIIGGKEKRTTHNLSPMLIW